MIASVLVLAAGVAMALAGIRLLVGPTHADRIVAMELVFSSSMALVAAAALASNRPLFLDVGIGLALVGFVGTLAWARLVDAAAKDRTR